MFLGVGNPFLTFLGSLHTSKLQKIGKYSDNLYFLFPNCIQWGSEFPPFFEYWKHLNIELFEVGFEMVLYSKDPSMDMSYVLDQPCKYQANVKCI